MSEPVSAGRLGDLRELFTRSGLTREDQLSALRHDQRRRWRSGEEVRAEAYLRQLTALADDEEMAIDLVCSEIALRREIGDPPRVEEYLARFPQFRTPIRQHFEMMGAMDLPALPGTIIENEAVRDIEPTLPAAAGPRLPAYEIEDELGRGGFGVVYKARHRALDRIVALKMVRSGELAGEAERQRFRTEAQAVARLQHPNIVQVFEVGEHNGVPFYSLEFCAGGSLEQKLTAGPLSPQDASRVVAALGRGVHAAHEANVLHRDLKPANVLLAADGTPKITDFGLAKLLDQARQTHTNAIMGTPPYMAPEQAEGRTLDFTRATDVYALGAILYECLTGRPPFSAATPHDMLRQVIEEEPPPPRRLDPNLPRELEAVCLRCLEKDPLRRYASAAELADDLERFLNGEPVRAAGRSLIGRVARIVSRIRMTNEANYLAWGRMMLAFAVIIIASHAATFFLSRVDSSLVVRWGLTMRAGQYVLMGLAFVLFHWPRLLPTTAMERQVGLTVIGYAASCLLVQAVMPEVNVYPVWTVLAGMTLFLMGSTFWGRCYAFSVGFFAAALLMAALPEGAPLIYGVTWATVLLLAGLYILRLARRQRRQG